MLRKGHVSHNYCAQSLPTALQMELEAPETNATGTIWEVDAIMKIVECGMWERRVV